MASTHRRIHMRGLLCRTAVAAVFCVIVIAGCHLVGLGGFGGPAFSHRTHVTEKKLQCADCHADYETSAKAGMPVAEICAPCHGDKDRLKPPQERADAFFKNGELVASNVTQISDEIVFSHQVHEAKGVTCAECHRGIEDSQRVTDKLAIGKPECMDCHARRGISNECSVCHQQIRRDVAPESHRLNWTALHGQSVHSDARTRSDCNLCHTENQCSTCHQEVAPSSHTNFWRQRGHGIASGIDRDTCRACHHVDFCDRCHQEAAPRSHTGSFASARQSHCITCHTPVSSEDSCFVCHKGTPSHFLATSLPSSHNTGMNCRQCHGAGQPLQHVDNGDNCVTCHR